MAIGDKKSAVMQSDIVNDFTTGGAENVLSAEMGKTLAQRPNPNLLDNWYFADPIDQRGGYVVPSGTTYYSDTALTTAVSTVTAYTTATYVNTTYGTITVDSTTYYVAYADMVRGYVGAGYGIDRWRSGSTTLAFALENNGVEIGGNGFLKQFIEQDLTGKTLTFSMLLSDGTLHTGTGTMPTEGASNSDVFKDTMITLFLEHLSGSANAAGFHFSTNAVGKTIQAAKLELGSTQTLAHQDEDGNWVLNDPPPNKQQELAKCQRYQVVYDGTGVCTLGMGQAMDDATINVIASVPVTMRGRPTPIFVGDVTLRNGDSYLTSTTLLYNPSSNVVGSVLLPFVTSGATKGAAYEAYLSDNFKKLILDANL